MKKESKQKKKEKIVIVGKGAFGDLMAKFLRPYFTVSFIRRSDDEKSIERKLKNAWAVVYAVPMVGMETSIKRTKPFVEQGTVIIDVTSVKVKPLQLIKKYFPEFEILGTHPICGPQSVNLNGGNLDGLPMVLCNETCTNTTYNKIKRFCKKELGCRIIEQSAQQHDHEMAHVQGLAHFIGRALKHMNIQDYATSTHSYHQLVELKQLLEHDSWELFETIQNTNSETKQVRTQLMKQLESLEKQLC